MNSKKNCGTPLIKESLKQKRKKEIQKEHLALIYEKSRAR